MGTTATIFTTDDCYRPSYSDGSPVAPTPLELKIGDDTHTAYLYFHYFVNINDENYSNATFYVEVFIGTNDTSLSGKDVRYTIELSTDNFSTLSYSNTISGAIQTGFSSAWNYYARGRGSSSMRSTSSYPGNCRNLVNAQLPVSRTSYKVRIRNIQWKEHTATSWSSATSETKTVASYAPFTLPVTKPSHFYLNGLNTFDAVIESQYIFDGVVTAYFENDNTTVATGEPVRNANLPYIKTGQRTEHIYVAGTMSQGAIADPDYYDMLISLSIVDPGDANFTINVCKTHVTGSMEFLGTDKKDYWTVSLNHEDPSGLYDTYGFWMYNTEATLVSSASVTPSYGVRSSIQYSVFSWTQMGYTTLAHGYDAMSEFVTQNMPKKTVNQPYQTSIRVQGGYSGYFEQVLTISADVWEYSVPSFPNLAVHRCNDDGSANDNGAYAKLEWSVAINTIDNQNSKVLRISHPAGITEYDPLDSYTQSGILIVPASTESAYTITFVVQDDLSSFTRSLPLSTAGVIMDWLYGGKGVAFGMVSSRAQALEVSKDWDLVCSKLELDGTDLLIWMKEMIARMDGIEEFSANLGSTDQFQVTFYNDDDLLVRHWILSGNDVEDPLIQYPELTPEKDPIYNRTYSYVGWSRTKNATASDPNALLNIQATRDIYAAFSSAVRYYTVFYYNAGELLQIVDDLTWHSNSAAYTGETPTVTDGVFVGWMASGKYIEQNTTAIAQFYYDYEITDSWEEILAACNDGTYATKYRPGNYKTLDLGAQGSIRMRIKGLNMHRAPGMKKLPISWEADTPLSTSCRFNADSETYVVEHDTDGFEEMSRSGGNNYYYFDYLSTKRLDTSGNDKATGTLIFTATEACTVDLFFYENSVVADKNIYLTMSRNGTQIYNDNVGVTYSSRVNTGEVSLSQGQSVTYSFEAYAPNGNFNNQWLRLNVRVIGGGNRCPVTVTLTTNKVNSLRYRYGSIGGFAESELNTWLQETVKPLFPEVVRNGLKKARLITASTKTVKAYPNYEYVPNDVVETDLFIPSASEIVGNNVGTTEGVDFDVQLTQFRKKVSSGTNSYWTRDTYESSPTQAAYIYGPSDASNPARRSNLSVSTRIKIYICFCT